MSWKALSSGFAFWITLTSFGHADTIVPITPSQENTLIESSAGTLSNGQGNIYAGLTIEDQPYSRWKLFRAASCQNCRADQTAGRIY